MKEFVKRNVKYKGLIMIVVGIICVIGVAYFGESLVGGKFTYGSNSYGSFFSRFSSISKNVEIMLKNPIFGCGRYNLYNLFYYKIYYQSPISIYLIYQDLHLIHYYILYKHLIILIFVLKLNF